MLAREVLLWDLHVPLVYPANFHDEGAIVMVAVGGATRFGILGSPGGGDAPGAVVCFFELQIL